MGFVYIIASAAASFLIQFFISRKGRKRVLNYIFPAIIVLVLIGCVLLYCGIIFKGSGSDSVIAENRYFAKCIFALMLSALVGCCLGTITANKK